MYLGRYTFQLLADDTFFSPIFFLIQINILLVINLAAGIFERPEVVHNIV